MQFEKIRRINKSKIIVGGVITLGVIGAITILPSFAKYRLTDSINIANGTVNYKVPDLKVMAIYQQNEAGTYDEVTTMPTSGYTINEEQTYCTTDNINKTYGKIKTENGKHNISNLNKGEKCYLYFDKELEPAEKTLAKLKITAKTETPDFSQLAKTDEGVFKISDGMYGNNSYYWRGAVINNYIKFANFCWRIVRINGDGSIRLIYDGATCHTNGGSAKDSIAVANQSYNSSTDKAEYAGYTYKEGYQRPNLAPLTVIEKESNLKTQTDKWYKLNISDKGFDEKVASGKFCNDREVASGSTWSSHPNSTFYYAAHERLVVNKNPILSCPNNSDIYTLKVGAITADEIAFAGGVYNESNIGYYLYSDYLYMSMTPSYFASDGDEYFMSTIFIEMGRLASSGGANIRPVINLKADVTFSSGDGTINSPFVVTD